MGKITILEETTKNPITLMGKPWGLIGDNLCINHLRYVASDCVHGKCR